MIFVGLWRAVGILAPVGRWLLFASLVGAVGSVSFLAWDTTRSIALVVPLMLLGLVPSLPKRMLPWLALFNLLLPAAYVWCGDPVTVPLNSIFMRGELRCDGLAQACGPNPAGTGAR